MWLSVFLFFLSLKIYARSDQEHIHMFMHRTMCVLLTSVACWNRPIACHKNFYTQTKNEEETKCIQWRHINWNRNNASAVSPHCSAVAAQGYCVNDKIESINSVGKLFITTNFHFVYVCVMCVSVITRENCLFSLDARTSNNAIWCSMNFDYVISFGSICLFVCVRMYGGDKQSEHMSISFFFFLCWRQSCYWHDYQAMPSTYYTHTSHARRSAIFIHFICSYSSLVFRFYVSIVQCFYSMLGIDDNIHVIISENFPTCRPDCFFFSPLLFSSTLFDFPRCFVKSLNGVSSAFVLVETPFDPKCSSPPSFHSTLVRIRFFGPHNCWVCALALFNSLCHLLTASFSRGTCWDASRMIWCTVVCVCFWPARRLICTLTFRNCECSSVLGRQMQIYTIHCCATGFQCDIHHKQFTRWGRIPKPSQHPSQSLHSFTRTPLRVFVCSSCETMRQHHRCLWIFYMHDENIKNKTLFILFLFCFCITHHLHPPRWLHIMYMHSLLLLDGAKRPCPSLT